MIALVAAALAQETVEAGTSVQITGMSRKDAFWRYRKAMVGMHCLVDPPGLTWNKAKWYGGSLTCEDGGTYYFYQVSLGWSDWQPPVVEEGGVVGGVVGGLVGGVGGGSFAGAGTWSRGRRLVIVDVGAADSLYPKREELIGEACTVTDGFVDSGPGWWSGGVHCDDGQDHYFYQVAVRESTSEPVAAPATIGASVAPGKMVRIVDVAAVDALAGERDRLVGHACSVVEGPLLPTGDAWFTGRLFCDDGKSYQFYQVGVEPK